MYVGGFVDDLDEEIYAAASSLFHRRLAELPKPTPPTTTTSRASCLTRDGAHAHGAPPECRAAEEEAARDRLQWLQRRVLHCKREKTRECGFGFRCQCKPPPDL